MRALGAYEISSSSLMVPSASFAAGDQDKSATTDKSKAPAVKPHKKPKKGHADDVHNYPSYERDLQRR